MMGWNINYEIIRFNNNEDDMSKKINWRMSGRLVQELNVCSVHHKLTKLY